MESQLNVVLYITGTEAYCSVINNRIVDRLTRRWTTTSTRKVFRLAINISFNWTEDFGCVD